jgi:hypothetical protein
MKNHLKDSYQNGSVRNKSTEVLRSYCRGIYRVVRLTCSSICRCHPVVLGAGNERIKLPSHNKLAFLFLVYQIVKLRSQFKTIVHKYFWYFVLLA